MADLLEHAAGLPGWRPLYQQGRGRAAIEAAICATPLEYAPRAQSIYSDLGFILLGFILEDVVGISLDQQFDGLMRSIREAGSEAAPLQGGLDARAEFLRFHPDSSLAPFIAPTEFDTWRGRVIQGEVHDENAAVLGGVAGHAGLFGATPAVGRFARAVLVTLTGGAGARLPVAEFTLRRFLRRSTVPGSSRALGWDTMLPTSSCGTELSPTAFGHTGFTGTSLWIDPALDLYVVLLTNSMHPSRKGEGIQPLRRAVHDAVALALRNAWF
jgi:CubicO group peptidase (beta-lactamase class C family)